MASHPVNDDEMVETPKREHLTVQAARMLSGMLNRLGWSRLTSFNGRRDYNKIFGWDQTITPQMMLYMYNRGGIAKRVVDSYPDAIWARPPVMWAKGDDAWTLEWAALVDSLNLWQYMHRLDKLAGLGHYAVMVIGTNKPGLECTLPAAIW
jgi:hypothetical protein